MKPAERLKKWRVSAGLRQTDVAQVLEITNQAVYNLEAGKRNIKYEYLEILASVYKLNPIWVMEGKEPMYINKDVVNKEAMDNEVQYLKQINKLLQDKVRMLEERLESYELKKGGNNANQKAG